MSARDDYQLLSRPCGYIVLTRQPLGGWRDDWDGIVHADLAAGLLAAAEASTICEAKLVALHEVEL